MLGSSSPRTSLLGEGLQTTPREQVFPLARLGDEILEHAGNGVCIVVVPRSQKVSAKLEKIGGFVAALEGSNTCGEVMAKRSYGEERCIGER